LAKAKAGFRRGTDACADVCGEAFALQALGMVRRNQGRLDEAATFLGQALKSFQALRCAYGQACVLFSLGLYHAARGDLKSSERVLMESVELFRSASCPATRHWRCTSSPRLTPRTATRAARPC
jgi:hypothetical protein